MVVLTKHVSFSESYTTQKYNKVLGAKVRVKMGNNTCEQHLCKVILNMVKVTAGFWSAKTASAADNLEDVLKIAGNWFSFYSCLLLLDGVCYGRHLDLKTIELLRDLTYHPGIYVL